MSVFYTKTNPTKKGVNVSNELNNLIKSAILRLAGKEPTLSLTIKKIVGETGNSRHPIQRSNTDVSVEVSLSNMTHVSTNTTVDSGLCLRLIFEDILYATHGKDAEAILDWAKKTTTLPLNKQIPPFPQVSFQKVERSVRVVKGELVSVY